MQCYLDDFDAPVIVSEKDASLHIGQPSAALVLRRLANARNGVAISESKAVLGALETERMGAWVDGKRGRVEVSSERLFGICGFGLYILGNFTVDCKGLAMFLGRVVHAFEFRRPLLSSLNAVWKYQYWQRNSVLTLDAVSEILVALTLLPLAFIGLRATIDGRVSCSDASEGGGGMCVSRGITEAGLSVLEECMESPLDVIHFRHQHVQSGTLACHVLRAVSYTHLTLPTKRIV